jgi:hypothetical protein
MLSIRLTRRLAALALLAGLLTACITPPAAGPTPAPAAASPTPPSIPTAQPTSTPTEEPAIEPTACQNDLAVLEDLTVPDGAPFAPGDRVEKTWRVRNTGTCGWHSGYQIIQMDGDLLLMEAPVEIPVVALGDEVELAVGMLLLADAPLGSEQQAEFQMVDPDGNPFGASLIAVITAQEPSDEGFDVPTPTPISG